MIGVMPIVAFAGDNKRWRLILRSEPKASVSKDEEASWFETHRVP
jgi:hypothetical protein